jgi:hypothetical protein
MGKERKSNGFTVSRPVDAPGQFMTMCAVELDLF